MTTFTHQDVTCPCCGKSIEITMLMSTNTFGKRTDFHSMSGGFPPIPIQMSSCEYCGFSGYAGDFTSPTLTDELRGKIQQKITPMVTDKPLDAGRRYELYAEIRKLDGDSDWELAHHYLVAAWATVDEGRGDEMRYRERAILHFRAAFDKGDVPDESAAAIIYLVGELYRRVGDTDKAATWFNRVIERAKTDDDWSQMAEIATRQRDDPQETF